MKKLFSGVARECITPDIGGQLFGYRPDIISESIEDDLVVSAFYFEQDQCRALMITATVCLINTELANEIICKISEKTAISRDNIILSATHTHSGPNTTGTYGWGDIDKNYCENIFIPKIMSAVDGAIKSAVEVTMSVAQGKSYVGINRRQEKGDPSNVKFGQDENGIFNPNMTILSFKDTNGKVVSSIIHYGAHGTAAGCNHEITRDWSGIMTDALEQKTHAVCAFFNGPEGDVGPRLSNKCTVGDITYVRELGAVAAKDALEIYANSTRLDNVNLQARCFETPIPLKPLMDKEQAEQMLKGFEEQTVNIKGQTRHHLETVIEAHKNGTLSKEYFNFRQTVIALGDVVFVSFPFELFSEIGIRTDNAFDDKIVLSLSNTNGSEGYFVTEKEKPRGGYEVNMHLYGHIQTYKNNADDDLYKATVKNIKEL